MRADRADWVRILLPKLTNRLDQSNQTMLKCSWISAIALRGARDYFGRKTDKIFSCTELLHDFIDKNVGISDLKDADMNWTSLLFVLRDSWKVAFSYSADLQKLRGTLYCDPSSFSPASFGTARRTGSAQAEAPFVFHSLLSPTLSTASIDFIRPRLPFLAVIDSVLHSRWARSNICWCVWIWVGASL